MSSQDKHDKADTWAKMQVTVGFDCACTVTQVSIQMQKRVKVLKVHCQKTDYVFLVNARPFQEQSDMSRGKYLAREGPGSRLEMRIRPA